MLAWRSILRRPHPVLTRLRPARRHATQLAPILGSNNRIGTGSRGYASNSNGLSNVEVNPQQHHLAAAAAATKRHLYVVLDDHKDGFGVHKLDVGDDDDLDGGARRLPDPPLLRVALPTVHEGAQFAAVGSSIVAFGKHWHSSVYSDSRSMLIYDTKTTATSFSSQLPEGLRSGYRAAMAVGNRLYMLESTSAAFPGAGDDGCFYKGDLHCLTMDPGGNESRDWKLLSPSSRWYWSNLNRVPSLPFCQSWPSYVSAWAVNAPPGAAHHDMYVSASTNGTHPGYTFSFSTASGKWKRHGEWLMPVVGHAHYDGELGAWLGLHAIEGDIEPGWRKDESRRVLRTDGHLCAGHITCAPSEWKVGREKMFRLDEDTAAGWRHVDAKLVPMGTGDGGSDYCIMERLRPDADGDDEDKGLGDGNKCLLRLTGFRVERGQDGEPVATARGPARSYRVSRYDDDFDAQAFWM